MLRYVDDVDSYKGYIPVENLQELLKVCKINGKQKYLLDLNIHDIDKKELKFLEKNSTQDITVLNRIKKEEVSPFELSAGFLSMPNRKELFEYLMDLKPNLFMPIKHLNCGIHLITDHNRNILELINKYLFKINPEMLYALIAFGFKPQQKAWIKWLYPKKEEKEKEK